MFSPTSVMFSMWRCLACSKANEMNSEGSVSCEGSGEEDVDGGLMFSSGGCVGCEGFCKGRHPFLSRKSAMAMMGFHSSSSLPASSS